MIHLFDYESKIRSFVLFEPLYRSHAPSSLVHSSPHLQKSTPRTCDTPGPWLRLVWNTTRAGLIRGSIRGARDRLITRDNVVHPSPKPRFSVRSAAISPRYTDPHFRLEGCVPVRSVIDPTRTCFEQLVDGISWLWITLEECFTFVPPTAWSMSWNLRGWVERVERLIFYMVVMDFYHFKIFTRSFPWGERFYKSDKLFHKN